MKLEALQSLSVAVMFVGLFLSALGGFGAYFFSGGSEREGRAHHSAQVESAEPDQQSREATPDARLAAIVEPVPEVTAKQLSLIPEPALPPIPEKTPAAPAPATPAATPTPPPPVAKPATPEPAPPKPVAPAPAPTPVVAKAAAPEKPAPAPAPIPEKAAPPKPVPAPAAPVAEIAKPAKPEPELVVAKAATQPMVPPAPAPETKPAPVATETRAVAAAPAARTPQLGIEPWQKEKMLQRLRTFQNGSIAIQVPQGNDEALGFATALKDAFLAAGWHVTALTQVKTDSETTGLTLSSGTFPPPTEVTTVFSALVSAGIKLSTELDPAQGKKHAVLFVGSRP